MKFKILSFKKILSTSVKAKKIKSGDDYWTIIVSESQGAGHGKGKRSWFSPRGGLYFSIVMKPKLLADIQLLTFAVGISVAKVLNKKFEAGACLKWPNDVLIKGKKVCGALVENVVGEEIKSTVIGIGINTNIEKFPPLLADTATSLKNEFEKEIDNKQLLQEFLEELEKTLKKTEREILKEYRTYENTLGKEIKILSKGEEVYGRAIDFDERGDLVVELKNKQRLKILEGDITRL
ncbi:MAG: biotin--[acetyl-CoA-carboxylase] ligase [bacterium]